MSEMVERVARVLFGWMHSHDRWDEARPEEREDAREAAHAAIAAMREPTSDQLEACGNHAVGRIIWRQMIDEALK